jgi:hypothetical protein
MNSIFNFRYRKYFIINIETKFNQINREKRECESHDFNIYLIKDRENNGFDFISKVKRLMN